MAQSQTNLTVGIGVDLGKLDADIRIAKAKMQELARIANAAARQAVRTGAPSDAAEAERASRAATQQAEAYAGLTRQKKAYIATTEVSTAATRKEAGAFRELTKYIVEFGKEAGLSRLSVRGLRLGLAGLVVAETIKYIRDGIKSLNDLQTAAREAGLSTASMAGLREVFRGVGLDAKEADSSAVNFFKTLRDSRQTMADARKVFGETLAKPGTTHAEATEAMNKALDEARKKDPFEAIGLHAENYAQTTEGTKRGLEEATKRLIQMQKEGRFDEASKGAERFGINLERAQQAIEQIGTGGVPQAGIKLTEGDLNTLKEANQLSADIANAWEKTNQQISLSSAALGVAATKMSTYQAAMQGSLISGGGAEGGFASGGFVRGPGSGTSDSILARLSNGEYVVNAGSVRRLGIGAMHAINNFGAGGLVGVPPIRFAAGGLVSAASSSGRPVHLHLGSQSFTLSGSSGVVDALVSHAHSQQIRSAGVKPSWFAGRPSGR
jgi:hypothetical protein